MSRHPVRAPENRTDYKEQKQTAKVVNSIVRRNVPESLSVEEVREATVNDPVPLEVMDIVISVRAFFCQGGGEPIAQKILSSCPNFYETVERKRGSYDGLHMKRKYFHV